MSPNFAKPLLMTKRGFMKNLLAIFIFGALSAVAASASAGQNTVHFQCKVTRVYDHSVFEEGLTVGEYPDVSYETNSRGVLELTIGASSFEDDGSEYRVISIINDADEVVITAANLRYPITYQVVVQPGGDLRKMNVKVIEQGSGLVKARTIALGLCMVP